MAEPTKNQLLAASIIVFLLVLLLFALSWSFLMNELSPTAKLCPIHEPEPLELPLDDFGINRARADGRNCYCKACIRRKVTAGRRAIREYRARRRYVITTPATARRAFLPPELTPVEKVKQAIRRGARTQKDIRRETGLGYDPVGDAIAELLLWTREIKTRVVDNARLYFINDSAELPVNPEARLDVQRQPDVRSVGSERCAVDSKRKVG